MQCQSHELDMYSLHPAFSTFAGTRPEGEESSLQDRGREGAFGEIPDTVERWLGGSVTTRCGLKLDQGRGRSCVETVVACVDLWFEHVCEVAAGTGGSRGIEGRTIRTQGSLRQRSSIR